MNSQNSPLQKKLYYRQIIELFAEVVSFIF